MHVVLANATAYGQGAVKSRAFGPAVGDAVGARQSDNVAGLVHLIQTNGAAARP